MAENIESSFDMLVTDISSRTHIALRSAEIAVLPPYVPLPGENCLETIAAWEKTKSGYDMHAKCMVDVTEICGLFRDSEASILNRRDLLVEWENGDSAELGLDEGSLPVGSEKLSDEEALRFAKRLLQAVEAVT